MRAILRATAAGAVVLLALALHGCGLREEVYCCSYDFESCVSPSVANIPSCVESQQNCESDKCSGAWIIPVIDGCCTTRQSNLCNYSMAEYCHKSEANCINPSEKNGCEGKWINLLPDGGGGADDPQGGSTLAIEVEGKAQTYYLTAGRTLNGGEGAYVQWKDEPSFWMRKPGTSSSTDKEDFFAPPLLGKTLSFTVNLNSGSAKASPCGMHAKLSLVNMPVFDGGVDGNWYCDNSLGDQDKGNMCSEFVLMEANQHAFRTASKPCKGEPIANGWTKEQCGLKDDQFKLRNLLSSGFGGPWSDQQLDDATSGLRDTKANEYGVGSDYGIDTSKNFDVSIRFHCQTPDSCASTGIIETSLLQGETKKVTSILACPRTGDTADPYCDIWGQLQNGMVVVFKYFFAAESSFDASYDTSDKQRCNYDGDTPQAPSQQSDPTKAREAYNYVISNVKVGPSPSGNAPILPPIGSKIMIDGQERGTTEGLGVNDRFRVEYGHAPSMVLSDPSGPFFTKAQYLRLTELVGKSLSITVDLNAANLGKISGASCVTMSAKLIAIPTTSSLRGNASGAMDSEPLAPWPGYCDAAGDGGACAEIDLFQANLEGIRTAVTPCVTTEATGGCDTKLSRSHRWSKGEDLSVDLSKAFTVEMTFAEAQYPSGIDGNLEFTTTVSGSGDDMKVTLGPNKDDKFVDFSSLGPWLRTDGMVLSLSAYSETPGQQEDTSCKAGEKVPPQADRTKSTPSRIYWYASNIVTRVSSTTHLVV
jgi:hypothetical protein